MKRGIFRRSSIDVCIEHRVLATPISPETLFFTPGERLVVATPKSEAAAGEFQFLFVIGDYLGENAARADALFGRPSWKHLYAIDSITSIRPFRLADVVAAAGELGETVHEKYKGQTQHHRIIRTIEPAHEGYWSALVEVDSEPSTSAAAIVERNAADAEIVESRILSDAAVVKKLLNRSKQNATLGSGRAYRPSKSQQRSREFAALVKLLYGGHCQVCGVVIESAAGERTAAQVHHLEAWDGDRSDRLDNVMCVCPNDHARFEVGLLSWTENGLHELQEGSWVQVPLALDRHLLVELKAVPSTMPSAAPS